MYHTDAARKVSPVDVILSTEEVVLWVKGRRRHRRCGDERSWRHPAERGLSRDERALWHAQDHYLGQSSGCLRYHKDRQRVRAEISQCHGSIANSRERDCWIRNSALDDSRRQHRRHSHQRRFDPAPPIEGKPFDHVADRVLGVEQRLPATQQRAVDPRLYEQCPGRGNLQGANIWCPVGPVPAGRVLQQGRFCQIPPERPDHL